MEISKKVHSGCGLQAKLGPNKVQCCEKGKETGIFKSFLVFYIGDTLSKKKWLYKHLSGNVRQILLEMPHLTNVRATFLQNLVIMAKN